MQEWAARGVVLGRIAAASDSQSAMRPPGRLVKSAKLRLPWGAKEAMDAETDIDLLSALASAPTELLAG